MVGALCFMGSMVGALFLSQFRLGFIIFGVVAFIGTLIAVLIVREPSNKGEVAEAAAAPKEKVSLSALRHVFPGWSVGRDYYLAFIGKMFQGRIATVHVKTPLRKSLSAGALLSRRNV